MPEEDPVPGALLEALSVALSGVGKSSHIHERASAILATLGYAMFVRAPAGTLRLASHPPEWLSRLWELVKAPGDWLPISTVSPFVENFLIDARECWAEAGKRRVQSGAWVERLNDGSELHLAATAFIHEGQAILLFERLGENFEIQKGLLQKGREVNIAYQRLNSEIQKKEILLHCLAFEMSAALGNSITSLRLLEVEQDPVKMRRLIELSSLASKEQERLIFRVLDVFSAELDGLYGRPGQSKEGTEVLAVVRRTIEALTPAYAGRGIRLYALPASGDQKVIDALDYLERVLRNLLEHVLEQNVSGSQVAIRIEGESDSVMIRIEDGSPEIPVEVSRTMFTKFEGDRTQKQATLRLDFCRIAVENAHGEIGHAPRGGGGNCLWVRWPKVRNPA